MTAIRVIGGTANPGLAEAVAARLAAGPAGVHVERFPDGELLPTVDDVEGRDVYVVAPTSPPVGDSLVELALLLDAARRAGAARLTAVVPYFGYARQDRRLRSGDAVGARVALDLVAGAGAQRLVVIDPHSATLEAAAAVPVEVLSAVAVLADAVGESTEPSVVVAPDLGAVTLAERYAVRLAAPVAVVRKHRTSGHEVRAEDLVGDVAGRRAVVVDDMVSTGATIEAAVSLVRQRGARPSVVVAATHGLFVGPAAARLARLAPLQLFTTDTTAVPGDLPTVEVCSIAPLVAAAVARLHHGTGLDDLGFRR